MRQKFGARIREMARRLVPEPDFVRFADAVEALTEAYAEGMREGQPKWIPVEEKLPESSGEYLVVEAGDKECSTADFFVELKNVEKSKWTTVRSFGQDCEERELFNVTHWQPLPALPLSIEGKS